MVAVREVMSRELVMVDPSTTVMDAARLMAGRQVGSALVIHEDALRGIFTERDVLRALAQHSDAGRVSSVTSWMTEDPVTIDPDATVGEALDRMLTGGFRHLPVMEGTTLVGVVSMRDLARSVSKG